MENRIDKKFFDLKKKNKKALACFVTSCDPDIQLSEKIIKSLPNYGADIIEIGIPFSDPMADGPFGIHSHHHIFAFQFFTWVGPFPTRL